ncbi:MAG: FKBP-type peptidyl-prolyl cis-trans isomerase [Nitrososphaeria archaeon]|nr:FKBP-type peptidyl-prolyl cis-trans isomerase [Conexivisphaerales archaeon]
MNQNSLILINYTTKIKETGEIIETTVEEVAKANKIYKEGTKYEPKLIAVGKGWILKALDEEIQKLNVGDKVTIEVTPEKAFGNRDPSKIKVIPLRKFGDRAKDVKVGDEIEYNGQIGTVISINSGRVQVDFNDKLAGKTLVYEIEIVKEITDLNEKIERLIRRRIDIQNPTYKVDQNKVRIEIPEQYFLTDGLQYIKRAIASDILDIIPEINQVEFAEIYTKKQ